MAEIVVRDCGDGYFAAGPKGGTPKQFIIGSSPEVALRNYAGWLYGQVRAYRLRYEYARRHEGAVWPACPVCKRDYGIFGHNLGDFPVHGGVQYDTATDEEVLNLAEQATGDAGFLTCVECYSTEEKTPATA